MRGLWRLRQFWDRLRLRWGAFSHLENATELLNGMKREARGELISEQPVLKFRNGVRIASVRGGYGGFTTLFPEIFLQKCYQPTPDFAPKAGWTVFDIGANMGFYTCQVATAARGVRVVAVEPVPYYAEVLRRNVDQNHLADVQVIEAAVTGPGRSEVSLTVWRLSPGAEPRTHQPPTAAKVHFEMLSVPAITLSQVFERSQTDRCDLLKIDIEGAEYGVFDSLLPETWRKIDRVVMETHEQPGRSEADLVSILERNQFEVSQKRGDHLLWARRLSVFRDVRPSPPELKLG